MHCQSLDEIADLKPKRVAVVLITVRCAVLLDRSPYRWNDLFGEPPDLPDRILGRPEDECVHALLDD